VIKIKRALLSVADKTGIVKLAKVLKEFDCEIISTGGTKAVLEDAGISVTDISVVTGNSEAFGGRMKTLSFNIGSALLFDREKDWKEAEELAVDPIDLVVCNLYPFAAVKQKGAELPELIENIDIGGPTMIRAGAKNYKYVAVVTDIADYRNIIAELKLNKGSLSLETRWELMRKTFNYTTDYDSLIASTMDELAGSRSLRFHFRMGKKLRYGENSHQEGYLFRETGAENSLYDMKVLHGKEISYNNMSDIHSAIEAVRDLKNQGCAIIKHNNPCGLAEGRDQVQVFANAWAGDPVSAYGSIIAFNKPVSKATAEFLQLDNKIRTLRKFVEVIVAPGFSAATSDYLFKHKNLRIIEFDPQKYRPESEQKKITGALLVQSCDNKLYDKLESVTEIGFPIEKDLDLIEFGINAVKQIRSNAIIIVRRTKDGGCHLLGMGAGQPNRLVSTKLAIEKAVENLTRDYNGTDQTKYTAKEIAASILVSDAFFPFADNVELAGNAGIRKIIQPGGSIRDKAVIKKCDKLGIAMLFTGIRHFKH
jgi:phosphoribosylaminoimidazolecarboxamide formyltransferase / IMP cyclohydrolase